MREDHAAEFGYPMPDMGVASKPTNHVPYFRSEALAASEAFFPILLLGRAELLLSGG